MVSKWIIFRHLFWLFYLSAGILCGTIAAIDLVLSIGFTLNDPAKLEETSTGFSQYTSGRMKDCVMAIDGWVCRTRRPNNHELDVIIIVINQTSFRNRKGVFGLVVFAGCSCDCKFMMLSIISAGSKNDGLAWKMSNFYHDVVAPNLLPPQHYITAMKLFHHLKPC